MGLIEIWSNPSDSEEAACAWMNDGSAPTFCGKRSFGAVGSVR